MGMDTPFFRGLSQSGGGGGGSSPDLRKAPASVAARRGFWADVGVYLVDVGVYMM